MKFVIAIWNLCDMTPWIKTQTLTNAQWDATQGFSTERRVPAWGNAWALLQPVDNHVLPFDAEIDVFYDWLWLPGDQAWPTGAHIKVKIGYAHTSRAYVGIETTPTGMLQATAGQVTEAVGRYHCDVLIKPSNEAKRQIRETLTPPPLRTIWYGIPMWEPKPQHPGSRGEGLG